jgi:hypothetical protein
MENRDDIRPFPIQGDRIKIDAGYRYHSPCMIPWWLAENAYQHYVKLFGAGQSLERIAERGGFSRYELLTLLRRENPLSRPKG